MMRMERVLSEDLPRIHELEASSFPADEAASLNQLQFRLNNAGQYFYKYCCDLPGDNNAIHGFVNGTCTSHSSIFHDTMSSHDASGRSLVIHSVTIEGTLRRGGRGTDMLTRYVQCMEADLNIDRIMLLSKEYLLQFYISCGFSLVSRSRVQHGQERWYEMQLDLMQRRSAEQLQIDAFAAEAFSGNPAAVVFEHRDDVWMQRVAMENNLAETSFITQMEPDGASSEAAYRLRWSASTVCRRPLPLIKSYRCDACNRFTPTREVELCGHATLAAAHALYSTHRVSRLAAVHFHTLHSGVLVARQLEDGYILLDFPATPVSPYSSDTESYCDKAALIKLSFAVLLDEDLLFIGASLYDVLVEVTREAFLRLLQVPNDSYNYSAITALGGRGLIVTCAGPTDDEPPPIAAAAPGSVNSDLLGSSNKLCDKSFDFFSRFFAPR